MDLIEIGKRIKAERKSKNFSQERLAEEINVTPHYIYEIERGLKTMSLETLINLSKALDVTTDYILFGLRQTEDFSFDEYMDKLSQDERIRLENIIKAILPYLK